MVVEKMATGEKKENDDAGRKKMKKGKGKIRRKGENGIKNGVERLKDALSRPPRLCWLGANFLFEIHDFYLCIWIRMQKWVYRSVASYNIFFLKYFRYPFLLERWPINIEF